MERKIEIITTILESGFAVLEVWMYGNDPLVFLVNKFTPSVESNVASIDYCEVTGYDVTAFIRLESVEMHRGKAAMLSKLESIVQNQKALNFQFHKSVKWIYWISTRG